MAKRGLIIVSNRLPVAIKEVDGKLQAERAIGGVATALNAVAERHKARWVGWSGLPRVLPAKELAALNFPKGFVPVQAGPGLIRRYYDHISNSLLWPSLHGMFTDFVPHPKDWQAFKEMNRRFAEAVQNTIESPDDLIWVHDYHLMLVPRYLREAGVTNRVGFFLHTPFAAPEFMLGLPYAKELLSGMCAADVVGFQTEGDVDNFWGSLEIAGCPTAPGLAGVFPIGADFKAFRAAGAKPSVRQKIQKQLKAIKGKNVIFSLSRLDYTKGIIAQLLAVERFFARYPNRESLVYKLVVAPSREQLGEYQELKRNIERVARRINRRLRTKHWQPIEYSYENLGFEDVVAWYKMADTLLLLPEKDGMNLVSKEYIAARDRDQGVLVLSKGMGSAVQLPEALLVDAQDTEAAASALERAQKMSDAEQSGRWQALRSGVRDQDIFWWAENFLHTLREHSPRRRAGRAA